MLPIVQADAGVILEARLGAARNMADYADADPPHEFSQGRN